MTDVLTLDRFRTLADAYGGAVMRWPEGDRAAAIAIAATPQGAAILAQAVLLDVELDMWRTEPPSRALAMRIDTAAASATRKHLSRMWLWWSGIGIAATLAGAAAGTAAAAIAGPTEGSGSSTSFGDIGSEG